MAMSCCWLKFVSLLALAGGSGGWSDAAGHSKVRILDFETPAMTTWAAFVPPESVEAECVVVQDLSVARAGSASARLHAPAFARFGVRFKGITISVRAGERYRLSTWVRIGPDFVVAEGTPGVLARLTLFDRGGSDFSGGHRYVGLSGDVADSPDGLRWEPPAPPSDDEDAWTRLEAEVVIPNGVAAVVPMLFVWQGRGTVWVDDIRFERAGS